MATAAPEIPPLTRDRAFEQLYRQYVTDVYRYALALLRNPADAEDVTQTTFMNAYRAYKRGDEIEKPQNWLIKIAHNVARSRYARTTRRVREVPLEDHLEQLATPDDEQPDVEAVLEALGRLPLNQRAALVMRELEGRTYAEIADTLGVSVPAVETLIFRGRRSLRLRASAIRVLSTVPVPTSLTQLLDVGGTAVVGGGAIVGGGFLLKAAVAVVAGVVATGVVARGNRSPQVAAAAATKAAHGVRTVGAEHKLRVRQRPARSLVATRTVGRRARDEWAWIHRDGVFPVRVNVVVEPGADRDLGRRAGPGFLHCRHRDHRRSGASARAPADAGAAAAAPAAPAGAAAPAVVALISAFRRRKKQAERVSTRA
ncbi:MAG: RNA polymerase sigma factor [Actinobacteria bacterium]|nr:MAG: RNA polymerase sigma factor [Actinomycetota bacterium]